MQNFEEQEYITVFPDLSILCNTDHIILSFHSSFGAAQDPEGLMRHRYGETQRLPGWHAFQASAVFDHQRATEAQAHEYLLQFPGAVIRRSQGWVCGK